MVKKNGVGRAAPARQPARARSKIVPATRWSGLTALVRTRVRRVAPLGSAVAPLLIGTESRSAEFAGKAGWQRRPGSALLDPGGANAASHQQVIGLEGTAVDVASNCCCAANGMLALITGGRKICFATRARGVDSDGRVVVSLHSGSGLLARSCETL